VPVDRGAIAARVHAAVAEVVERQVKAGVDIVNDGEMSKPSYATYVKDRLAGFGGTGNTFVYQDLAEFPEMAKRVFGDPGRSRRKTPACNAAISVRDAQAPVVDTENLKSALGDMKGRLGFLSAASPGVVSLFFRNDHYPSVERYIFAIADAMRHEYEAVAKAGFILQLDCPDLAMGRHIQYADLDVKSFRKRIELHIEAFNHATAGVKPEQLRMHVCWGNYEGPHTRDIALGALLPVLLQAKPGALLFEGANPRHAHEWTVWREIPVPDDLVLVPGCIDSTTNFVEHHELVAQRLAPYVEAVGAARVIAGTDCGFSTFAGYGVVDPDIAWEKLRSLKRGAAIAAARARGRG